VVIGDWSRASVDRGLERLLGDRNVDLVVALGLLASNRACLGPPPPKPIIASAIVDAELQGLPNRDGTSGVHNLSYIHVPAAVDRDLRRFHDLVDFERLAVLQNEPIVNELPELGERVRTEAARLGIQAELVPVGASAARALGSVPANAQAAYLFPLPQLRAASFDSLLAGLTARGIPTFSLLGQRDVERGVLAGASPDHFPQMARRLAVTVQRILSGDDAGNIPTGVTAGERLRINAQTARALGWFPNWADLAEAEMIGDLGSRGRTLTLVQAMREGLESNVDLAAQEMQTRAGQADVASARAALLPQADASLLGARIDADRATAGLGLQPERSVTGAIDASQVLFSEGLFAQWSIEKSLQRGRERDLDAARLDTARAAGGAYLDLLRARTLEQISTENLLLTRSHLETARLLETVGTGGRSDVYRWESEIATNRKETIEANATRNRAEIQLNRILNRPAEEPIAPTETGLDDPEISPSLETFLPYFSDKATFRRLRDFVSQEALESSPELQRLDASVAAAKRGLESATRAFYLPNLGLEGTTNSLWWKDGAGSESPVGFGPQQNDTSWRVGVRATYPLLRGGDRFAARSRARDELASLELQRESLAQRIGERIRGAMHAAGASYAGIHEARVAADFARQNLDLVTDAYTRGAATYIALLDAQNAHVVAEQAAANAKYDFLDDWLEVQRAAGRFDFTRTDAERQSLAERMRAFVTGPEPPSGR
jgi:outer membrane protein TolC